MARLAELVKEVAERLGFSIEEPRGVQPPPGFEWVRDIAVETPFAKIVVRVFGSDRDNSLVLAMPIGFSDVHRKLLAELPVNERASFLSKLFYSVVMVCPRCRVGYTGVPQEPGGVPEGIVAELRYIEKPEKQRLADDIVVMLNIFFLVNAMLTEKFPGLAGGESTATMYT